MSVAGPGSVSPACAGALGLPSTTLRQSFEGPARARLVAALPSWLQARAGQAVGVLQSVRGDAAVACGCPVGHGLGR